MLGNQQAGGRECGTGHPLHRICSHPTAMPIALRPLLLADVLVLARVRDPFSSSDPESGGRPPAKRADEDSSERLSPERLSALRRRVATGHYDLPETLAALARRLLDVLR